MPWATAPPLLIPSAVNNLATLTDANGNTTRYGYDADGNLTSITYANGSRNAGTTTPTARRGLGQLPWQRDRYTYDAAGRIITKTYADGSETSYTYDSRGNLLTATDTGGPQTFTYNSRDELTRVDCPAGNTWSSPMMPPDAAPPAWTS